MHNIEYRRPHLTTFWAQLSLCYSKAMLNSKELRSNKDITQGNPTTMAVYGIALTPFRKHLVTFILKEILKSKIC